MKKKAERFIAPTSIFHLNKSRKIVSRLRRKSVSLIQTPKDNFSVRHEGNKLQRNPILSMRKFSAVVVTSLFHKRRGWWWCLRRTKQKSITRDKRRFTAMKSVIMELWAERREKFFRARCFRGKKNSFQDVADEILRECKWGRRAP